MAHDLKPLLTGSIIGLLMRSDVLDISVAPVIDKEGNYLPKIVVRGNQSGEAILITLEDIGPT